MIIVAIVDDDASFRAAVTRVLRLHAMEPRSYPSAHAFLTALPSALPHCLIADVNMPEMTGLDIQRELLRTGFQVPTIVITGRPDASIASTAASLGADAVLSKPVASEALIEAIATAVTGQSATCLDLDRLKFSERN